ncbi:hypothetical protein A605_06715 [Corynebacterium halotolerans YIM 70093 = DSM 44683]|uniref:Uncharacterized protein n=2 Tax=Corynebacterium halotolerans TaxID=225326 RepID=M1NXW8_9CORY|nr:hypothetical protein A605_06715 [Corynebacterium halotolerans YIM 70093 = DSM 44683]
MIITAASAAAIFLAAPVTAHAQLPPEVRSVVEDAGSGLPEIELPDPRTYLDGVRDAVGSSGSPELNTGLTLLADWAIGAALISVVGGLVATFSELVGPCPGSSIRVMRA